MGILTVWERELAGLFKCFSTTASRAARCFVKVLYCISFLCQSGLPAAGQSQLTMTPPFLCGALSWGCHEPCRPASSHWTPPHSLSISPPSSRTSSPRSGELLSDTSCTSHRYRPHLRGSTGDFYTDKIGSLTTIEFQRQDQTQRQDGQTDRQTVEAEGNGKIPLEPMSEVDCSVSVEVACKGLD